MADIQIEARIRAFLAERYASREEVDRLRKGESLLGAGIMDSLGVVELAHYVADTFEVEVNPKDLIPEYFDSIAGLERFLEERTRR